MMPGLYRDQVKFRDITPVMEHQIEKQMDNEMETGLIIIQGFPKSRDTIFGGPHNKDSSTLWIYPGVTLIWETTL